MKVNLIWWFILVSTFCKGQIVEDFGDGDFHRGTLWRGDTSAFKVNDARQLQLNQTGSGTNFLSTSNKVLQQATWEFRVELNFNPSSRNFCRVYLVSDLPDLTKDLKGYYVQIGGSLDEISLYRQDISQHDKIIDGPDDLLDSTVVGVNVQVTTDLSGNWSLLVKPNPQSAYVLLGTGSDQGTVSANFFGFWCRFTSSRSMGFFLDDIIVSGQSLVDSKPPEVVSLIAKDRQTLELQTNEPVATPGPSQFLVPGFGPPINLYNSKYNTWKISFQGQLESGVEYTLQISNLEDYWGNKASGSLNFIFWEAGVANENDVIISEIMADPEPALRLPDKEYLEIYNRSDKPIELINWTVSDATRQVRLSAKMLLPGSFLVLCPETLFSDSIEVLQVPSLPNLNNTGDLITLADSTGKVIHFVNYTNTWYGSELKRHGGWALEMIDTNFPCSGATNWTASNSISGGTPGKSNSVATDNPDLTPPTIVTTFAQSSQEIQVTFDQPLSINSTPQISIHPPINIDTFLINPMVQPAVTVFLNDSLSEGTIYELTAFGFADCNQNVDLINSQMAAVGLSQSPDSGDVIINELLFNPRPLGVPFVELFNRSSKAFNLKNWRFARWQSPNLVDFAPLTVENLMLYPGDYMVFSEDLNKLKAQHPDAPSHALVEVSNLPALPDKQGSLVLVEPGGAIIDALNYQENMHHPLLTDHDGVSLERASSEGPSDDPHNWFSGSENTGYATPARKNSQSVDTVLTAEFMVVPEIISPLNGHYPSYARISFQLQHPGSSGSVLIFNNRGFLVKTLVNNSVLPLSGMFQWDGTDDRAKRVPWGTYIVVMQIIEPQGPPLQWKDTIAVAPIF